MAILLHVAVGGCGGKSHSTAFWSGGYHLRDALVLKRLVLTLQLQTVLDHDINKLHLHQRTYVNSILLIRAEVFTAAQRKSVIKGWDAHIGLGLHLS